MVEVFKTNVESFAHANLILREIHRVFPDYTANFDLDDCDRILRIASDLGEVSAEAVIRIVGRYQCDAEVLPDTLILSSSYHTN